MKSILAFDFGTQGVKAALYEENSKMTEQVYSAYSYVINDGGRLEQNPEHWWKGCLDVSALLKEKYPNIYANVCCISLTGQMHGIVPIAANGFPADNCIVWCDTRSEAQVKELEAYPDLLKHKMVNTPSCAYTAPKLLWLKQNKPEVLDKTSKLLYCKDYIRYRLTGEFATDHSDASGSLLYNFDKADWDTKLISALGLCKDIFPQIRSSTDCGGYILPQMASILEIKEKTPVIIGAGDLSCSLLGSGVSNENQVLINLGTAGQVMTLCNEVKSPSVSCHLLGFLKPKMFFRLASLQSAAYCLQWFSENVLRHSAKEENDNTDIFLHLDQVAAGIPVGADGLLFTPYLKGTGTPYGDSKTKSSFVGLDAGHTNAHMIRAIMEGVCFGVRDCISAICPDTPEKVFLSGGGSKSLLWQSIMADVLRVPVYVAENRESTVLGAALLGATYKGFFSEFSDTVITDSDIEPVSPNPENINEYNMLYEIYQKIYPAQKEIMEQL
jgi:xylulokinase